MKSEEYQRKGVRSDDPARVSKESGYELKVAESRCRAQLNPE
jgi:hypothetical protein